jgi:hypothetical protein
MAVLGSSVSNVEKKNNIFSFLSPRVVGELLEDFVIATDAALDKPGAC